MKRPFAVAALIAVGVAGGAAWWHWRASLGTAAHATGDSSRADASAGKGALSPEAVLKIRPSAASPVRARDGVLAPLMKTPPSDLQKLFVARDYAEVLKRAQQLPQNGEALRLTAQILEDCVKPTDAPVENAEDAERYDKANQIVEAKKKENKRTPAAARADFVSGLLGSDVDYQKRVSAYDRLAAAKRHTEATIKPGEDPCASVKNTKVTTAQLKDLWKSAADAGDPRARMRQLECSLSPDYGTYAAAKSPEQLAQLMEQNERREQMTEEKLRELKALIALRRDDFAVPLLTMLTSRFANHELTIDDVGLASRRGTGSRSALTLAQCDLKGNCEETHQRTMDTACAFRGECSAATYEDYLRFYELSPASSQKIEQQRAALSTLIASGDAERLRLVPRPLTLESEVVFSTFYPSSVCY
jgi:hypothetical protein